MKLNYPTNLTDNQYITKLLIIGDKRKRQCSLKDVFYLSKTDCPYCWLSKFTLLMIVITSLDIRFWNDLKGALSTWEKNVQMMGDQEVDRLEVMSDDLYLTPHRIYLSLQS